MLGQADPNKESGNPSDMNARYITAIHKVAISKKIIISHRLLY